MVFWVFWVFWVGVLRVPQVFLSLGCFDLKIEGGKVERWFVERDGLMMGFRERKRNGKKAV